MITDLKINNRPVKYRYPKGNAVLLSHPMEIMYLAGNANYCTACMHDRTFIVISRPLKYAEEVVDPIAFVRCHKEYLVNLDYIDVLKRDKQYILHMKDGKLIPVSRRKKAIISQVLKDRAWKTALKM